MILFVHVFLLSNQNLELLVAIYVDDLNLIRTPEELQKPAQCLKNEFEMKDLGKTRYCLGLQTEQRPNGIFIHQSTYTEKILKRFNMDKAYPLSTPMIVQSLDHKKDPFRPKKDDEKILGPEVPYLNAIGAMMYLAQCTRPDIVFSVNLLARFISEPTRRHWKGVKHIFRYLRGTIYLGLFYSNELTKNPGLVGYADAGYFSDPHKARSQIEYIFTFNGTSISWKSTKQTLVATSSNHSEILALHEASRECIWLRYVIHHIQSTCRISSSSDIPTVIYENNVACITQLRGEYIQGDKTKHISPKFFCIHELQQNKKINIKQIRFIENLVDMFTKALPTSTFEKIVYGIGMRRFNKLLN